MTNQDPLSTSVSRPQNNRSWIVSATIVGLLVGLFAIDRGTAAGLEWLYSRSGESLLAPIQSTGAETVVVGTSTAKYAFLADGWPGEMVSVAQNGQTIFFSIAAALAMKDAPTVQNIIIGIDPYDLQSGLDNPSAERIWRIAPLIYNEPNSSALLRATRPASAAPIDLASWRFRGTVDRILRRLGKLEPEGYHELPAKPQKRPVRNTAPPADIPKIHTSLHPYIEALRRFAIASNKIITLVVTPAYYDPRWSLPDQEPLLDDLAARFQGANICNLTKLDGAEFQTIYKTETNFHDGIHMSRRGAELYTELIAKRIDIDCR